MAEETVILHFEIDQGAAEKRLEKIEKLLLDNKAAQQELSKAYKTGTITQEEYVKENIRLQQNIAKEQNQKKVLLKTINTESNSRDALRLKINQLGKEYDSINQKTVTGAKRADELQKELAQLNDQLNKGSKSAGLFKDNIGRYPDTFGQAASSIRVAGVSIGDVTSKLAAFANPATAALGVTAALGAAYARSTLGAKDLEFAQNQLAAATTLVSNSFASFITSAEDGQGAVTTILNGFLKFVDKIPIVALYTKILGVDLGDIADKSKEIALAQEKIQDLAREELAIREQASGRIEANQDLLQQIADEELSIVQRLEAADKIEENLVTNKTFILEILRQQLKEEQKLLDGDKENETLQTSIAQKKAAITKESAALDRQITKINKTQDDLNSKLDKENQLRRENARINARIAGEGSADVLQAADVSGNTLADPAIKASKARQDQFVAELKTVEFTEDQKRKFYKESADIQNTIDEQRFQTVAGFAALGAALFGEQTAAYKTFASASTIISTYAAATKAYESAFLPVPTVASPALGAVNAALAIAQGLANLAVINGVEFAEGGWTGPGNKWDEVGVVHADEYVTPKHIVNSPAAQPHIAALESMRLRPYADGGFVTNQSTAPINQSLIIANALKNMPPVYASWSEGERTGRRVRFKEQISTLGR